MSKPKKKGPEASALKELYTQATAQAMYFRRAFRLIMENHPDFRGRLALPDDTTEEALAQFLGQVRAIVNDARRKREGDNEAPIDGDIPMYIGDLDSLPTIFNPVTMGLANLDEDG